MISWWAQSFQRHVIWIYGNHDEGFQWTDSGEIEFRRSLALGTRLMVVHGDDFDTVMPNNRWFLRLFKFCHLVRLRMGANPVHVAELAKRWAPRSLSGADGTGEEKCGGLCA